MKSIKQQYIDLKEGRMSQVNFMRNLRMTLPQYVTNTTSYNDAVKILRNKGILNENIIKQLEKGIKVEKEHTKDEVKAAKIALDHLKEDPKYYTKLNKAGLEESHEGNTMWVEALVDILDEKGINIPEGFQLEDYDGMTPQQAADKIESELMGGEDETDAMIKKAEEEEAGKYTTGMDQFELREAKSWTNTSGKEMYAQFKELDNLNAQEVLIGIDFEMEENHDLSKEEATKIVARKLKQNPNFYTAHALAGKEMKEIPTIGKLIPGSDQMKPLKNESDLVDKDNGLKPVKGVEKIKASANKASKETNKPEGTISLMTLVAKTSKGVTKMVATGEKMKVVKEGQENYYQTNTRLKPEEQKKIKSVLIDAEFEWDEDDRKQVVYSKKSEKEIKNVVDNVTGIGTTTSKASNPSVNLGKYDLSKLAEIVREVLDEMDSNQQETDDIALGIDETMDGRDNLTDTAGHQLDENK